MPETKLGATQLVPGKMGKWHSASQNGTAVLGEISKNFAATDSVRRAREA